MSIVQMRAHMGAEWLGTPFPPVPNPERIIQEWLKPGWETELFVYPSGYIGNVSPPSWRRLSSYFLHVADSGMRAELLALGNSPSQRTATEVASGLRGATEEEARAVTSRKAIGPESGAAYVSMVLPSGELAIGGIVLYLGQEDLALARQFFPEVPVQMTDGQ